MATSAQQDATRKLSADERKLVVKALQYAHKGALRAVTSADDDVLKDHHQKQAYAFQSLSNRFATTELDIV